MARLFGYNVGGGDFIEPIDVRKAPRRDEPTFSENQRAPSFWARVVWYSNQWTPRPLDIPLYLRIKHGRQNPVVPSAGQRAMRNTGGISRVVPESYSAQVLG